MDKMIRLTQEELRMIYTACMNYGNKLEKIIKIVLIDAEMNLDDLKNMVADSQRIARKISFYMEG